jgi:hypothetical protein
MGHRRQRFIVDVHQLGAVLCGGNSRCNNHRNDLSAMTRLHRSHWEMRRDKRRGAVFIDERNVGRVPRPDRMGYGLQTVGQQILARQHGKHPGRNRGRGGIYGTNERMRVRRADHHRIGLAGEAEIIAVAAFPGQQPEILPAPDRLSDPGVVGICPHQSLSKSATL